MQAVACLAQRAMSGSAILTGSSDRSTPRRADRTEMQRMGAFVPATTEPVWRQPRPMICTFLRTRSVRGKGRVTMRCLAMLLFAGVILASAAQAEKRTFIIANNSDAYGVDRCLATGASCGAAVASAYCQARDYMEAASFRRIEREEIAGAVPTTTGTSARGEFVAIECLR